MSFLSRLLCDDTLTSRDCELIVFCQWAGYQFFKRAFSARRLTIKTALMTVVFYQHFDDYFVMVSCLTAACLFALQ